ncbi:ATPase [Nocardioides cynanchi]|uniref:ATPase n=1 Tax=Nocardioides cynanchi TaxID=2558918 RepID=UPI0012462424|nr:ATPase [Nocardioides cynanchi]
MTHQQSSGSTAIDPLDRIEKSIDIDATADRVWDLVSRPGWWINDGTVDDEPVLRQDGDVTVLTHPRHGEFQLLTVEADRPSYAAFRWLHAANDERPERSTLVEFRISPRAGGVTLSVTESGFASLSPDRAVWLADRAGNVDGWDTELGAARTYLAGA